VPHHIRLTLGVSQILMAANIASKT
jgi:hypothetical protein